MTSAKTQTAQVGAITVGAALALGLLSAGSVFAQAPSDANAVFVGGTSIMRVTAASGGYSPQQRATAIQERLNRILALAPLHPSDVTVTKDMPPTVRVKGHLFFTADQASAQADHVTPVALANQVASRLRTVLPSLTKAK